MKCYLAHFRGDTVPGGRQGDATWNTFAGIPCQVDGETDGKASFFIKFAGNHTQL